MGLMADTGRTLYGLFSNEGIYIKVGDSFTNGTSTTLLEGCRIGSLHEV